MDRGLGRRCLLSRHRRPEPRADTGQQRQSGQQSRAEQIRKLFVAPFIAFLLLLFVAPFPFRAIRDMTTGSPFSPLSAEVSG